MRNHRMSAQEPKMGLRRHVHAAKSGPVRNGDGCADSSPKEGIISTRQVSGQASKDIELAILHGIDRSRLEAGIDALKKYR